MASIAPPDGAAMADQAATDIALIDERLADCLRDAPGRPERLMRAMRYAVLGPGKRLRPRLALMAARACGGDIESALPAACAVEMIHAYSLAHDDLPAMDDDDLRRGRPTVHREFDEATAILVGDALLALALETIAAADLPPAVVATSCLELAHAAGPAALVGGQADDLAGAEGAPDDPQAGVEHLRAIHARKTGAMITTPLRLGAIATGADADRLAALTAYGAALGLAFQVTDDLLDAAGDEAAVGKRVGKDAEAGKLTYPGLMGLEASRDLARKLVGDALAALEGLGDPAEPLRELGRQMLVRDH